MKVALAVLASLFVIPLALADCRVRVVANHEAVVVNHAAVAVAPIAVATFLPIAVPVYSVTYQAPAGLGGDPALAQEIAALRKEIAALKTAPPQQREQSKEAGPAGDAIGIFKSKCSGCHSSYTAAGKGGGFVLLEGPQGQLASLNFKQALRVGTKTYRGEMPPNGKLSDEEVGTVQAWLDGLK